MAKPRCLSVKLVDTEIFQMNLKLSLFIADWYV